MPDNGDVNPYAVVVAPVAAGKIAKGDVLNTARIAGIQAAKQTSTLIPLCHPLPLTHLAVDLTGRVEGNLDQ